MCCQHNKFWEYLRSIYKSLSFIERSFVITITSIVVASALGILYIAHKDSTVIVPADGGTLVEGIVGTPRFINPLLAQTDADRDLTVLVYAGLMRALPEGGLIPDIAETYEVSEDETVYTFILKKNIFFHDNTPITADDVVFTVQSAQDPRIGSTKAAAWEGVLVSATDEHTVVFTLPRPYAGFLSNTTLGILPRHIWSNITAEDFMGSSQNEHPIGSGPFMITKIKERSGKTSEYILKPFERYSLGKPHISKISIRIFGNEKELISAFSNGDIDSFRMSDPVSFSSSSAETEDIRRYPLPRTFGLFLNYNKNPIFTDTAVRKALSLAISRSEIVNTVLGGFGTPIFTPLPPHIYEKASDNNSSNKEVHSLLKSAGWNRDAETGLYMKGEQSLSFSIKTVNSPEMKLTAELLQKQFGEAGFAVSVELFDLAQLNQTVIRTRDYEALLFGQVLSRDGDLYPFWHSSQRNDPGLNVALYTNVQVDAILEKLRTTSTYDERIRLYESFLDEWQSDAPAVFLYVPDLVYVLPEHIKGVHEGPIQEPSGRFLDAYRWYMYTQRIFTFLLN
jgi:peptide/nickel transport system substrate-binding protein